MGLQRLHSLPEWEVAGKKIKPVSRRSECDIDDNCARPRCNALKALSLQE